MYFEVFLVKRWILLTLEAFLTFDFHVPTRRCGHWLHWTPCCAENTVLYLWTCFRASLEPRSVLHSGADSQTTYLYMHNEAFTPLRTSVPYKQRQTNMHWILVHHRHDSSPCFWTHSSQEVYGYWAKERFAAIFCSRAAQPQPFFFCVQMVFVFFPCCKVFVVWIFSYCFQCAVNTFHSFRVFSGETSTLLPFKTFSYGEMVK